MNFIETQRQHTLRRNNGIEFYGSASKWGGTVGVHYSPDYFAETDKFWYLYADYSYGFTLSEQEWSLDLHIGYNLFDEDEPGEAFLSDGQDKYIDYSVGVSTTLYELDWSLAVVGTDLDDEEYFDLDDQIDTTLVLSVSKSL